jgi:acetyl-CoA carboxylase biotin carboxyl carrier protein
MAKLDVDTALIETLAELLQRTGLTEIELGQGEARIRVARAPQPMVGSLATTPAPGAAVVEATAAKPIAAEVSHPGAVLAPMAVRRSSPSAARSARARRS